MLKKAGIVVAISAATALSMSPLAFAGDFKGDSDHKSNHSNHKSHHTSDDSDCAQDNSIDNRVDQGDNNTNFLNIQNNTLQVDPQVCGNQVADGIVVGILGKASNKIKNS